MSKSPVVRRLVRSLDTQMKVVDTWQTAPLSEDSEAGILDRESSVAHVRVLTGSTAMAAYLIDAGGLSIGREDCDLVIEGDIRISRKHARIERSIAGWQFQDLNSRNGFFVNGRGFGPGERVPLPDGSVIRLGDSLLVFRAQKLPDDDRGDSPVFPGISPAAATVRRRIDALAAATGHVLILGETGTGKERVARAIGEVRTPPPLVTLNCAQLSRELARAELFGYVRGAFTHAINNKPGLVDLAGDGALFLDEIGELPFDVQAELLRFLEDGSYRAVGSTELRHSHARVVAATNVDLDEAVHQGKFRRDLLARLRAANTPLELPPLRDRREDVLGWTQLFFRQIGRDAGPRPWATGALECLLLYPWPENLRELLGAVRHAATEAAELPCERSHLPAKLRAHRHTLRAPHNPRSDDQTPAVEQRDMPPRQSDPGREEIEDALRRTEGRMRSAAQLLGVDRRKLYRLCERFGIVFEAFRPDTHREDE